MAFDHHRKEHVAASVALMATLGGYAVWSWGDRFYARDAAAAAPASGPPPSTAPQVPEVETLPPLAGGRAPLYPPQDVVTGPLDPIAVAGAWVEEDRGRPMGLGSGAKVPDELRHYEDDRRFLAVQMAAAQESNLELPHDDAAVIEMLRAGTLVEVPALTTDHVLYEVGEDTTDDPMAHYDAEARKDVPLFAAAADLDAERARLQQAVTSAYTRRERIQADARLKLLATYYDDPGTRDRLLREGAAVTALAANWDGRTYDLKDSAERRQFKVRLLSCVRPEARDILVALAQEYHARFHRLLPITSLVRSQRYQRRLGQVNANATKVDVPPHTTGCAFDVSFRYMAADEQQLIYDRLAGLERDGKVEALRERRNHVHVYVFPAGRPPSESTIAQMLDDVEAARGAARGR